MTYAMAIDSAINGTVTDEVREKLEALKAQLAKRNGASRKPTKTQKANEGLKDEMVAFISEPMTAGDVAEHFGISNQKASALLTALVNDGRLVREVIKRKAYFKAVA